MDDLILSEDLRAANERHGKECYGKYCACLDCRHEEYFCVDHDQGPCYVCNGRIKDITTSFCVPSDEELGV
jgi:hypothetical protein